MENDKYTYKNLLIALRNNFKNMKSELDSLKEYTSVYDENIVNYYFFIHKWVNKINPDILCQIDKKTIFGNVNSQSYALVNDSFDHLCLCKGVGVDIDVLNNNEFKEKVSNILSDDISNKMFSKFINGENDGYEYGIQITPSNIKGSIINRSYCNVKFDYDFMRDVFSINNFPLYVSPSLVDFIINSEYSKDKFDDYFKNIIDNNNSKDIVLNEFNDGHNVEYNIIEDKNKVYFKSKKRK